MSGKRIIHAPRGNDRSCKGWHQEAAMRMLMNNLDPDVAEDPDRLVVYGGTGRAARSWEAFDVIIRSLRELENDETLLVQSGKPVGKFRTHDEAPRVLIANSNLVGHWSNYTEFNRLERLGLTMYGQMTAGSWIYIGSQGIVQGTFETFAAAGRKHFGGSLEGKFVLTGGLGGMGGAQPLAATMNGALFLGVEVDPARIEKRLKSGYCDKIAWSLDEALELIENARKDRQSISVGLVGNCADVLPEVVKRLRAARHVTRRGNRFAGKKSRGVHRQVDAFDGCSRRSHARLAKEGRGHVRLREQHSRSGEKGRRRELIRYSRLRS